MDILVDIITVVWILGLAAVFGGFFHQIQEKSKDVTNGMFLGGVAAAAAWIVLTILGYVSDDVAKADTAHLVVYAIIALGIAVLVFAFRKARKTQPLVWAALGVLSALGLVLRLFW